MNINIIRAQILCGLVGIMLQFCEGYAEAATPPFEWVASPDPAPSINYSKGLSLGLDTKDNIYVVGDSSPGTRFGAFQILSSQAPGFLAKYSPDGKIQWAVGVGRQPRLLHHAVSAAGESYITAVTPLFNGYSVLKFNTAGTKLWERAAFEMQDIVMETSGNLLLSGQDGNQKEGTLARFDSELRLLRKWQSKERKDFFLSVAAATNGCIFMTGGFNSTNETFGSVSLTDPRSGTDKHFVIKFDAQGEPEWIRSLSGPSPGGQVLCATDPEGSVCFLSGIDYNPNREGFRSYLTKFNARGDQEWFIYPGDINILNLDVDNRGRCLVSGQSSNNCYLATFDGSGNRLWSIGMASTEYDAALHAVWNSLGQIETTGYIGGSASFGNWGLLPASNERMFLAKLTDSPTAPRISIQPTNQYVVSGSSTFITVEAGGTPSLSYSWLKNGFPIELESTNRLFLKDFQAPDATSYTVVVSSSFGSVTSAPAILSLVYRLDINVHGSGQVTRVPDLPYYLPNTSIELTAIPGPLDDFLEWSGEFQSAGRSLTVIMDTNYVVGAHFVNTVLEVAKTGEGIVQRVPDRNHYGLGDSVQMVAVPGRWFRFGHWEDGTTLNSRSVIVGISNSYRAAFEPITALETLTIGGGGRLAPVGMPAVIVNGTFVTNSIVHTDGPAHVELSTSFDRGIVFYSLNGTSPTFIDRAYTAPFALTRSSTLRAIAWNRDLTISQEWDPVRIEVAPTYQLHTKTAGGGTVTASPALTSYPSNKTVVVTAKPSNGWTFLQWLGDATGTNPTVSLTMSHDTSLEAIFGTSLRVSISGGGALKLNPDEGLYPYGSIVTTTGVPELGHTFALWSGDASGTANPLPFVITNPQPTVAAGFVPLPSGQYALTVRTTGSGSVMLNPPGSRFRANSLISLTAVPDEGQQFVGWDGDFIESRNPLQVRMSQSRVLMAHFSSRPRLELGGIGPREDGRFITLRLIGERGQRYQIEGAEEMSGTWSALGTATNVFGAAQFEVPLMNGHPARYFRTSLLP